MIDENTYHLNKKMAEDDASDKKYERLLIEYGDRLERNWTKSAEGQAAIADMIAENSVFIARLMTVGDWRKELVELKCAINCMAERATQDMLESASESVIADTCDARITTEQYDEAVDAMREVM